MAKIFILLISLIFCVNLGFSQKVKVTVHVFDSNGKPLTNAFVYVRELAGYSSPTDTSGFTYFNIDKELTIHYWATLKGYKKSETYAKRVEGTKSDNYEIFLEKEVENFLIPTPNAKDSSKIIIDTDSIFCHKKNLIYPLNGTYFKWNKKPFKTVGNAGFNWWVTTISLASLITSGSRQWCLANKTNQAFNSNNPTLNSHYRTLAEKNFSYWLIPSTAVFLTTKVNFHLYKKKYCKQ